jgi:hypothetical protein
MRVLDRPGRLANGDNPGNDRGNLWLTTVTLPAGVYANTLAAQRRAAG